MADLIGRLDKRPADVMVADDPELEGQSRFLRITDRRRHAGIGDRDDDVRVDMAFAGEFSADPFARLVDAGPFDDAVGPGEVDMLKNAEAALVVLERHYAAHPGRPDNDDLSGLDVALELGADDVERAGFRSQYPGLAEPSHDQRPYAERVAHSNDLVLRKRH